MNRQILFWILLLLPLTVIWAVMPYSPAASLHQKTLTVEDFDNFPPELTSFRDWDTQPEHFEITTDFGYNETDASLHLFGNTAKVMSFYPVTVDSGDVWQTAAYIESTGDIIAIGFSDPFHTLFYSIAGDECLDIEEWITVYQGIYPEEEWFEYNFPISDDWQARFGYLPRISSMVFVNNVNNNGEVYFDEIKNITRLLPQAPVPSINYEVISQVNNRDGSRDVAVNFAAEVFDEDSDTLSYSWQLGDGSSASEESFLYTYTVTDDHPYTVTLTVIDDTFLEGYASCQVEMETGETTLPLTINFTGDIILAREIGNYIDYYGYEVIFDPTMELLGNAADLTVVNLECPLTDATTHHPTKTIYFKGDMDYAEALTYAGVDVVTLANNHILDYMEEGINDTREVLSEQGILYSGAGLNSYEAYRPVMINRKGINLAFLASSDRTGQYNNYQPYLNAGYDKSGFAYLTKYYMQKSINEVRDVSDLVVMELHCGSEYSTDPSSGYDNIFEESYHDLHPEDDEYFWGLDIPQAWDMEYRHFAVDAGADLVICHHPHIIQALEVYNGTLIAHSLGNFIFDLSYTETMPTYILNSEIGIDGFQRFFIKPCYIDDNITKPAEGELGIYILDHIAHKSRLLNSYLWVDRENILAEVILDTLSMPVYTSDFIQIANLEERDGYYNSGPVKLNRIGSISSLNSIEAEADWEFRLGREIIYHGNYEDEGCSEWNINSNNEWLEDENVYAGQLSLGMQCAYNAGDNYITNLEGRIKCYDDAGYSLHGNIMTQNAGDSEVQIRTYESRTGGNYINMYGTPALTGDNDWTYVWQDLPELDEDANFIDYRTTIYPPDVGNGYAFFDNVGLIGWTEWQSFNGEPVEIASPNEYYYIEMRTTESVTQTQWEYSEINYGFRAPQSNVTSTSPVSPAVLHKNYPNPFNPQTTFSFTLSAPAENAHIDVFNIKGQKIRQLSVDTNNNAGRYNVIWQGDNEQGNKAGSGIYFYRLMLDDKVIAHGKCLLLK